MSVWILRKRLKVSVIMPKWVIIICTSCGFSVGICIIEEESGDRGVTMELEMQWDGNPNIVLDIKTRVGVGLPIQVNL